MATEDGIIGEHRPWTFPDISSGTAYFHKKEHGQIYFQLHYPDSKDGDAMPERALMWDGDMQTHPTKRISIFRAKSKKRSTVRLKIKRKYTNHQHLSMGIDLFIPKVEEIRANMSEDYIELIDIIQDNDIGDLHYLFDRLPEDKVRSLVNSCDNKSWTPLIEACVREDDSGMVQALLRAKAAINHAANDGATALDCAVQHNLEQTVNILLEHPQLDVNVGQPVFMAAQEGHTRILGKLLAAKAHPDRLHADLGITPLGMACQEGHAHVVSRLLRASASINVKDKYGRVPLEIARSRDHHDVMTLFGHQHTSEKKVMHSISSFF